MDALGVGENRALGDLELEVLRADAGVREESGDLIRQLEVEQVGNRQVDRHVQLEAGGGPRVALPECGGEDIARERLDQGRALGDRDELARGDEAALGMLPADERLGADESPVAAKTGIGRQTPRTARMRCQRRLEGVCSGAADMPRGRGTPRTHRKPGSEKPASSGWVDPASRLRRSPPLPTRRPQAVVAGAAPDRPARLGPPAQCPRQESNLRTRFRKPLLFPLSYGGRTRPG